MVETGDWLSPQLDYVAVPQQAAAALLDDRLSYLCIGVNEFAARLPSAVAGLLIILFVWRLGTLLFDVQTGLLAGLVLLATGGFFVETHEVRPDLLLTAAISGSLVAIARLIERPATPRPASATPARRRALLGLQVALAAGLLAKGMLALIVPTCVVAVFIISERRFDVIAQLLHPRAWWLLLLLVAPWHLAMALQHTGFLWDYVINQHILFFFDRKIPRDSVPVSVPVFWGAFALRLFPWTVFAPLALIAAVQRARCRSERCGDRLLLAWTLTVLLFFSAAASRMEHYCIPALPAVALLIAKLLRDYAGDQPSGWPRSVTALVVVFAATSLAGPFLVPRIVAARSWLAPIHELPDIARQAFTLLAAGAAVAAAAALARRRLLVAPAIAAAFVLGIPMFTAGMGLIARVNSSRPMATVVATFAEPPERIVYEAPIEYQNCAGFNFYLRRRLDLVRPSDFVAPRYLEPYVDRLFITRDDLRTLWEADRIFFITDPLQARPVLDGVVPKPVYIVARDNVRWVVSNQPVH